MISQLLLTILFFLGFLIILIICELLHNRFGVNPEYTRKIGHVTVTLISLAFVFLFNSHWYILLLGLASFILLYFGKEKDLFKYKWYFLAGLVLLGAGLFLPKKKVAKKVTLVKVDKKAKKKEARKINLAVPKKKKR